MVFAWDSDYEATPTSALGRSLIDNTLREVKSGVRERFEVEHEFGPNTDTDTGRHTPGGTTVMPTGTDTPAVALPNAENGAIYLKSVGAAYEVWVKDSVNGWVQYSTTDHNELSGRNDHDHPKYIWQNGDTLESSIDMGDGYIDATDAGATDETYGPFLLSYHRTVSHTSWGNLSTIKDNVIKGPKLITTNYKETGNITGESFANFDFPSRTGVYFMPQAYITRAGGFIKDVRFAPSNTGEGWALYNNSGTTYAYQVKWRYVDQS